jgi:hypothetical protein
MLIRKKHLPQKIMLELIQATSVQNWDFDSFFLMSKKFWTSILDPLTRGEFTSAFAKEHSPASVNLMLLRILTTSVPHQDPEDPYVFGPPGSVSLIYLYGYRSGSVSFYQQANK